VTLAGADLAELEIVRSEKNRALQRLQIAGLVQLQPTGPGRRTKINLLWTGRNCIDIKDQG
jgi:hypothetical protein